MKKEPAITSAVENYFLNKTPIGIMPKEHERIPVVCVDNFVTLGQITALRFLEWVVGNPGGLVALPTGKTPEFFIKWTQYYLENWNLETKSGLLGKLGFRSSVKPDFKSLSFVQLDEFFPINPKHEFSFSYFVKKYYIDGFGFDSKKAMLIDTFNLSADQKKHLGGDFENLEQIFPDGNIDLTLRTRHPVTKVEELRKKTIKMFDQFCEDYEEQIRQMGGIGFFLGGIGPDGHIAFNVKGSSFHSHTRLTRINYETQAAAAVDLGGIEAVRKKAVITMGLETITFSKDTVAIIIAAGEAKANIVAAAIENDPVIEYPASSLGKLPSARFYLTTGSALRLKKRYAEGLLKARPVPVTAIERAIIDGALNNGIALSSKIKKPLAAEWDLAEKLSDKPIANLVADTRNSLLRKIERGLNLPKNQTFLHTGPHHDDIELAYFPIIHHLVRSEHNKNFFCYCTSGFTSVTGDYVLECLQSLDTVLTDTRMYRQFSLDKLNSWESAQDDITGYLNGIAEQSKETQAFFLSCRLARLVLARHKAGSIESLGAFVKKLIGQVVTHVPGRPDPEIIQYIKGCLREFEAELVWAHFGIGMENVKHLRLQFYTGQIFPQYPDYKRDVLPIKHLLDEVQPTIITLAMDPEGSGPDTHFKTLIALAQALDEYVKEKGMADIRIWGYRNVWTRFHASDVNMIVPVSLNSFAVLHNMFNSCFLSQVSASFPSYEFDGPFNQLAQKVWVDQHKQLVNIFGEDFFYENVNPLMRRSYGAIYIKDMTYHEFSESVKSIKPLLEAKMGLKEI